MFPSTTEFKYVLKHAGETDACVCGIFTCTAWRKGFQNLVITKIINNTYLQSLTLSFYKDTVQKIRIFSTATF